MPERPTPADAQPRQQRLPLDWSAAEPPRPPAAPLVSEPAAPAPPDDAAGEEAMAHAVTPVPDVAAAAAPAPAAPAPVVTEVAPVAEPLAAPEPLPVAASEPAPSHAVEPTAAPAPVAEPVHATDPVPPPVVAAPEPVPVALSFTLPPRRRPTEPAAAAAPEAAPAAPPVEHPAAAAASMPPTSPVAANDPPPVAEVAPVAAAEPAPAYTPDPSPLMATMVRPMPKLPPPPAPDGAAEPRPVGEKTELKIVKKAAIAISPPTGGPLSTPPTGVPLGPLPLAPRVGRPTVGNVPSGKHENPTMVLKKRSPSGDDAPPADAAADPTLPAVPAIAAPDITPAPALAPAPAVPVLGGPTLGQKLLQARTEKGFSLSQVSELTHVRTDYLTLIEADAFDQMPVAAVYTRSYIKTLCRHYGLDPVLCVAEFEAWRGAKGGADPATTPLDPTKVFRPEPSDPGEDGPPAKSPRSLILAFAILGAVVVIIIAASLIKSAYFSGPRLDGPLPVLTDDQLREVIPPEVLPMRELPVPTDGAKPATGAGPAGRTGAGN